MRHHRIISLYNLATFLVGLSLGFGLGYVLHNETVIVRQGTADTPAALASVNLMIDDGMHVQTWNTVTWKETMSPLSLLETVAGVGAIKLETRNLDGNQQTVAAINDIRDNQKNHTEWKYWVNNTEQPRAGNKYFLKPGDIVLWRLSKTATSTP
jgi:hypothetical protein